MFVRVVLLTTLINGDHLASDYHTRRLPVDE